MSAKNSHSRRSSAQLKPARKPVSKTFVIVTVAVAALIVLGVLFLLNTGFVGKAIQFSRVSSSQEPTLDSSQQLIVPLDEPEPTPVDQQVSVQESSQALPQVQDLTPDGLTINFEANDVTDDGFWLDIYLTSQAPTNIRTLYLKLAATNGATFTNGAVINPIFGNVDTVVSSQGSFGSNVAGYLYLSELAYDTVSLVPQAKIHFGRVEVRYGVGPSPQVTEAKAAEIKLDPVSPDVQLPIEVTYLDGEAKKYNLNVVPLTVCIPRTVCSNSCGILDNGCGGVLACPSNACAQGQVCVNNACISAVGQALPANAPQHDKTVLNQISGALSNAQQGKLQKLAAIVNAVKAWLAAQP